MYLIWLLGIQRRDQTRHICWNMNSSKSTLMMVIDINNYNRRESSRSNSPIVRSPSTNQSPRASPNLRVNHTPSGNASIQKEAQPNGIKAKSPSPGKVNSNSKIYPETSVRRRSSSSSSSRYHVFMTLC